MANQNQEMSRAQPLLLATSEDVASKTLAKALLHETHGWKKTEEIEEGQTWFHESSGASLWWLRESFLYADNLDKRWESATGRKPTDVIFLSRHAAASGRPSLTVHPIGNPVALLKPQYGGQPGVCCMPSPGLAPIFRELCAQTKNSPIDGIFDVSLEATHHGPYLETPSMFVEIGSTEEHWDNTDAAKVWAATLSSYLGLDHNEQSTRWENLSDKERGATSVVVGLGGGHYAPKHGDLARQPGAWLGHILASYNFNFESGPEDWQMAVLEAIRSTQAAFPGCKDVVCHLDKKSFKGSQRSELMRFLESQNQQYILKPKELSFSVDPLSVM